MTIEPIKEKLDDKIKRLNSSRVIKKVTPKGDLSWYVKWASVFFILFATVARSVGTVPQYDMWFGLFGTLGWAYVGYLWHDRALLVLNSILVTLLIIGLANFYFGVIQILNEASKKHISTIFDSNDLYFLIFVWWSSIKDLNLFDIEKQLT